MAVMDAEIRDAIYLAATVVAPWVAGSGQSSKAPIPTDRFIRLQQARLVRFLSEIDGDLTVSDLLEQMRGDE